MKNSRILFDKDYYRLQAILLSDKFEIKMEAVRKDFEKIGCVLPTNGFTTAHERDVWINCVRSKGINESIFIDEILIDFGIDPLLKQNDFYKLGLKWNIFFNISGPPTKFSMGYSFVRDKKKNPTAILVRVDPWTTKIEYEDYWQTISQAKQQLLGYQNTKNKEWELFERDLKIYTLYLKFKNAKVISDDQSFISPHAGKKARDIRQRIINQLKKDDYKGITTPEMVDKAIKRFKKLLSGINFD